MFPTEEADAIAATTNSVVATRFEESPATGVCAVIRPATCNRPIPSSFAGPTSTRPLGSAQAATLRCRRRLRAMPSAACEPR